DTHSRVTASFILFGAHSGTSVSFESPNGGELATALRQAACLDANHRRTDNTRSVLDHLADRFMVVAGCGGRVLCAERRDRPARTRPDSADLLPRGTDSRSGAERTVVGNLGRYGAVD